MGQGGKTGDCGFKFHISNIAEIYDNEKTL